MARVRTQASEAEVGRLHAKVTKIFNMSLDQVIAKLEEDDCDVAFAVDPKLLNTIIKFIADNKMFTVADEEDVESPLAKKLAEIRAKAPSVVPLRKEG